MRFQKVVIVAGVSAWAWIAAAAPDVGRESAPKPLDVLIKDLGHEKFRMRETASREIWVLGAPALESLQEVAAGSDPERAYRARDLIRKIQLQVTPDTDASVIDLVDRYDKSTLEEKVEIFQELHKQRAWRQLLMLYAAETSADLQARLQDSIGGVAVMAARERLLDGDADGARDFLEMAPADAAGLLALADFHRSQGTLAEELGRAKTLVGKQAAAWQLALHRADGNLVAAISVASAAEEPKIGAMLAALAGDPLPWLRGGPAEPQKRELIANRYSDLAILRWQGKPLSSEELAPLVRAAGSKERDERAKAIGALFLLGEARSAEAAYAKISPTSAFSYFETLERIPDALMALGLDGKNPDYSGWVQKRAANLAIKGDAEDERDVSMDIPELILMANFLERRGLVDELSKAFGAPMEKLAEVDPKLFTELLGAFFGNAESIGSAPQLARRLAVKWAGEDAERWDSVITAAFGGQDATVALWDWLAELNPEASRIDRLDGMLAMLGMVPDPLLLRDKWLSLAWGAIDKAAKDDRKPLLQKLASVTSQTGDVKTSLRIWDQLEESDREGTFWRSHIADLSAAGRWAEAAAFFRKQIEQGISNELPPQPTFYACLAACLRRAGQVKEAAENDALVEKLALGHDAAEIANGYAFGSDYRRAADWWARAARQQDPVAPDAAVALGLHLEMLLEQEKWSQAGSLAEMIAQMVAEGVAGGESQFVRLKLRLQADLGRALGNLKDDRAGSIRILENTNRISPGDGFMADYFFPAVRRAGLIQEHDKWFNESWRWISGVSRQFPNSDNTHNTAGWLASRANRNLGEAEEHLKKALAMNPNQAAYLDTMAEIEFAKGNRAAAVEWSGRAINTRPEDALLRRQHQRFVSGPLPR